MSADLLEAFGSELPEERLAEQPFQVSDTKQFYPRPQPLVWNHHDQAVPDKEQPLWQRDPSGADVLFDASEGEEDDGFGEFEVAQDQNDYQKDPATIETPEIDLLGLDDDHNADHALESIVIKSSNHTETQAPDDPFSIFNRDVAQARAQPKNPANSFNTAIEPKVNRERIESNALLQYGHRIQKEEPKPATSKTVHQDSASDDEWEKFEDGPATELHTNSHPIEQPADTDKAIPQPLVSQAQHPVAKVERERPTNVPPPYSLLQVITPAIQSLASESRTTLSNTSLLALANSIVSLYCTTSRLIAGRSHRWKRDTILSQSMRISFAGHKNTGMKLTSLDRSETIKEDQEAIEAVSCWTKHNHSLNPVLSKAKVTKPAMSLNAQMKIRVMNGAGVLNEREPCVICGLKRNERVIGIDVRTDDIFEEFWIEHWGHADCCTFWFEYKHLLTRR